MLRGADAPGEVGVWKLKSLSGLLVGELASVLTADEVWRAGGCAAREMLRLLVRLCAEVVRECGALGGALGLLDCRWHQDQTSRSLFQTRSHALVWTISAASTACSAAGII